MAPINIKVASKKQKVDSKNDLYSFLRIPLLVGRCAGLLPIQGLGNATSKTTRGTLRSWYSAVYLPTVLFLGIEIIFLIYDLFTFRNKLEAVSKFMEFTTNLSNYVLLLILMRLSLRWEALVRQIESINKLLPAFSYKESVGFVKYILLLILVIGVVECLMLFILTRNIIEICVFSFGLGKMIILCFEELIRDSLTLQYIFETVITVLKLQTEFLKSFVDVVIIITSIYLTNKFKLFNQILLHKQKTIDHKRFPSLSTLQVHYTRISGLVTIIDDNINLMILLSYFTNLLRIMKKIFYITKYDAENIIYLTYSCLFILLKLILVSYFASNLHTESRKPLDALHEFPTMTFDPDMRRLMIQVYHSNNCLTGYRLFQITRQMILAMVTIMTTYELVLFQF